MGKTKNIIFLLFCSMILICSFTFYLLGCYPAIMSTDSINQWTQFTTKVYHNWHPIVHTLFDYLCTIIWHSPASIAIAQILILVLVFIYGISVLLKFGVNKIILLIAALFFALFPANGFLSVTLWKDVLYSIMLLWITIIHINIVMTNGDCLKKSTTLAAFVAASLGTLFFRYNGILTFCFIMAGLMLVYRKFIKTFSIITISLLLTYFIVTDPISKAAGVIQIPSAENLGIPMQQVAAVIHYDGKLTENQKQFFNRIMPLELWKNNYTPYNVNNIKFDKKFDVYYIAKHKSDFIKYWFPVIIHNPSIVLTAYLKQTSLVWRVNPYPDSYTNTVAIEIVENDFGLCSKPLSYTAYNKINNILNITQSPRFLVFFWRPALWLYISIASIIIITMRLNKRPILLLLIPIVSNSLAFMLATPAQDYRYQYCNILISSIMIPFAAQTIYKKNRLTP